MGPASLVPRWERFLAQRRARPPWTHHGGCGVNGPACWTSREIRSRPSPPCNAACVMCPYPTVLQGVRARTHGREPCSTRCSTSARREPGPAANRAVPDERGLHRQPDRGLDRERPSRRVPHAMVTVTTNGSPLVPRSPIGSCNRASTPSGSVSTAPRQRRTKRSWAFRLPRVKANIDYLFVGASADAAGLRRHDRDDADGARRSTENIRYWESRGVPRRSTSMLVNRAGNVDTQSPALCATGGAAGADLRTRVLQDVRARVGRRGPVLHGLAPAGRARQRATGRSCVTSGTATPTGGIRQPAHPGPRSRDRVVPASARTRCHEAAAVKAVVPGAA